MANKFRKKYICNVCLLSRISVDGIHDPIKLSESGRAEGLYRTSERLKDVTRTSSMRIIMKYFTIHPS